MKEDEVCFRLWNDTDEEQILALFRAGYGDFDIAYPDYFDWEYRRNPLGRSTIGIGHLPNGTVVTALATFRVPVIYKGTRLTAVVLVNGVTHPDYRGKDLFSRCGNFVCDALRENGIALSYGLPNPTSFPSLTRKIGYGGIGRAVLLARAYDPVALLASRFPPVRRLRIGGISRALLRPFLKKPAQTVSVEAVSTFDGLPMAHVREDATLVLDTDVGWLTWRYLQIPRWRYHVLVGGNTEKPRGVAVYRIADWRGIRIGTVNDLFLAADAGQDVVESLMHAVFAHCEAERCAAVFCLVSPTSRKLGMLGRAGFQVVPSRFEPQPFDVILKGHTVSVSGITVADMEVSFGIYDIF